MTKRAIKQFLIFFLILGIAFTNTLTAFASDDFEVDLGHYYPYDSSDIRSSILTDYDTDENTQLYHVVANCNFTISDVKTWTGVIEINFKKGDILLMYDVPELQDTDRASIIVRSGFIIEIDRKNLKADKKGNLFQSAPIDVNKNGLTSIFNDIPGVGKYIYEKPDLKSKKIGVLRKNTVFASSKDAYEEKAPYLFLLVPLMHNQTGYVYLGNEKDRDSFSLTHFINER